MKFACRSGASIAAAAATLILAGAVASAPRAEEVKGHCVGANACKGQSACESPSNGCSGENACKGNGFLEMTKEQCDTVPGAKFEPAKEG